MKFNQKNNCGMKREREKGDAGIIHSGGWAQQNAVQAI